MGKECRVWVVFANERKCNHTRCLLTKGFVSWVDSYGFEDKKNNNQIFYRKNHLYSFLPPNKSFRSRTGYVCGNGGKFFTRY